MQDGIDQAAENAGLGKPIDILLARKEMNRNGPTMFAINTDQQLRIEPPSTLNGSDVVLGMYKGCNIVVCLKS